MDLGSFVRNHNARSDASNTRGLCFISSVETLRFLKQLPSKVLMSVLACGNKQI